MRPYAPSNWFLACTWFRLCTPCRRCMAIRIRRLTASRWGGGLFNLGEKTVEGGRGRLEHCSNAEVVTRLPDPLANELQEASLFRHRLCR